MNVVLLTAMVFYRDAIVGEKCTYKTSPSKIEITLVKAWPQKWSTLKAVTALGTVVYLSVEVNC